jgi:hypothetical protein
MCGEDGQWFIRLLNHFELSDPSSTPSLDFPVYGGFLISAWIMLQTLADRKVSEGITTL